MKCVEPFSALSSESKEIIKKRKPLKIDGHLNTPYGSVVIRQCTATLTGLTFDWTWSLTLTRFVASQLSANTARCIDFQQQRVTQTAINDVDLADTAIQRL